MKMITSYKNALPGAKRLVKKKKTGFPLRRCGMFIRYSNTLYLLGIYSVPTAHRNEE
jgi:hypothetical protein